MARESFQTKDNAKQQVLLAAFVKELIVDARTKKIQAKGRLCSMGVAFRGWNDWAAGEVMEN